MYMNVFRLFMLSDNIHVHLYVFTIFMLIEWKIYSILLWETVVKFLVWLFGEFF